MDAPRAAALVRRYHRYEALQPFVCPADADHYLLEPFSVAGDVLLICPVCGHADLLEPELVPVLEERARRAAAFWRGIRY
jgi:hypothetical protein